MPVDRHRRRAASYPETGRDDPISHLFLFHHTRPGTAYISRWPRLGNPGESGAENPKDEHRAEVALLAEGPFAGGSCIDIQRYIHDLAAWNRLSVAQQEQIIARSKQDDEEFASEDKPETAHIKRVSIEEDGESVEILRHSMPYGTVSEHGLYFISYAGRPDTFRRMLAQMIVADKAGHYDHLMDYSRAVTGASFFAPPRDWLAARGG